MRRVFLILVLGLALGAVSTPALAQGAALQKPPTPPAAQKPAPPAAPTAAAQPAKPFPEGSKIAFINVPRIAAESSEGKALNARAMNVRDAKLAEIAVKSKQLETARQKLASGGILSDQVRAATQKEADKLQIEIQRMQQDAETAMTELTQQLQEDFQRKLTPVIEKLVADMGLHVLLSRTDTGVVWLDPSLDLTAEAIRRFDAAMAGAKPPAKAPAPSSPKQ